MLPPAAAIIGLLGALAPGTARAQPPAVPTPGLASGFGLGTGTPAPSAFAGAPGGGPEVRLNSTFLDTGLGALLPSRGGNTQATRAFDWFGNITLFGLATDNFRNSSSNRQTQFQGTVRPTLGVVADSARVTGSAFYSPGYSVFAGDNSQPPRLDHRFGGNMTGVIVPDRVFLNARAFGALVPVLPGQRLEGDQTPLARDEFSQSTTFILSPYVVQPFGTLATGIAGYTYNRTERSGRAVSLEPGGLPVFVPNVLTTHTGFAALRTGEDFGRFVAEARVNGSTFEGGGPVTDGGHRALALIETRYAFTRTVSGLVEGGYENVRFGGTRPLRIDEPVWGVGVRLDPGPNTSIIARYRRRNGFDSPAIDARTALGPRTLVFANYAETLGTGLLTQSDLLTTVTVDELGNTVDSRTGSPTSAIGGGALLGAAGSGQLNRVQRGSIGASRIFGLNQLTLTYTYDRLAPVSVAPGTLAFAREAHTGSFTWSRPLTPQTTLIGTAQVGFFDAQTGGVAGNATGSTRGNTTGTNYLGRAVVRHLFTERLSGSVQYQLSYRTTEAGRLGAAFGSSNSVQNTLIATLTQAF